MNREGIQIARSSVAEVLAPRGADVWLYMLPFALALGIAEETRKRLVSAFCRRVSNRARP
jgi:hypothetical protein